MTKVFLVDDHKILLPGIKILIESIPGFSVAGEAYDGLTAVREITRLEPDICIVDLSIPMLNGFGVAQKLQENRIDSKIILLTSFIDDSLVSRALQYRISGYVLKENNTEELKRALLEVRDGNRYFCPSVMTKMINKMEKLESDGNEEPQTAMVNSLTPREQDVLMLVANGLTGKEICGKLNISESTLKKHKTSLLRKMDVKTSNELIALVNKDERFARLFT